MNSLLRRLVVTLSAVAAAAAPPALGQEPTIRLEKAAGASLELRVEPGGGLDPSSWNLYRGTLGDLPASLHRGDPDGRCGLPGDSRAVLLDGELGLPGDFYYLSTERPPGGPESSLGDDSFGVERPNRDPCPSTCGTELVPLDEIRGTEGLAIGDEGTVYFSQRGFLGRRPPGGPTEGSWVALPGATTVWGIALRGDGILFVGSPTGAGTVFRIDSTLPAPVAEVLFAGAGGANGVTVGPDGACYYSDFTAGRVYRLNDAGVRSEVTAAPIDRANGLLFDDDGSLLVLAYSRGEIWRLSLDASFLEQARELAGSQPGSSLDGIAKDELGRFYLSDNSGGRLLRVDSDFGATEVLLTGAGAAANISFGRGALDCLDVHVASSGDLARFHADATGRP